MSITKTFFVAIDKLYEKRQNPKRLERALTGVTTVCDVVYSRQFPEMSLDVNFVPRTDGSAYPVIFEIHGGGFAAGDKKYRRVLSKFFAKQTGAFVVNVNYGVGRENAFPLPVQHLVAASNWVVNNAETYNLDLSRFAVAGDSAGAYYAAFLCAMQSDSALQKEFGCSMDAKFTAAVLNCGLYSFEHAMKRRSAVNKGICMEFTGMPLKEAVKRALFQKLSVTNRITDAFPPSFVVYSAHDIFCKGQAELLLRRFEEHGVPFDCVRAAKIVDNHDYNLKWKSKIAVMTNRKIVEYLNGRFYSAVQSEEAVE
ncbi:MAG: alpha/beta hydrolase [Corallococcus sp.]|nr:alpha/beta hydrolase [Corallococcus sp.]MCM1360074.1 alpha/beta hydrolase [Corallococcus sp.]MCM1395631.1 alpha/beta hydrolase [Corallococcus sp.]